MKGQVKNIINCKLPYLPLSDCFDTNGNWHKDLIDGWPDVMLVEFVNPAWDIKFNRRRACCFACRVDLVTKMEAYVAACLRHWQGGAG